MGKADYYGNFIKTLGLGITKMACQGMSFENEFLKMFGSQTLEYNFNSEQLIISNNKDDILILNREG